MKRDASRAVFSGQKGEMEGVDGYADAIKACAVRRGASSGAVFEAAENLLKAFSKSPNSLTLRQRTFEKQRRFPPAKKQHPSCRAAPASTRLAGWYFQA